MSRYLGVEACNQGLFYFISYNSEDESTVSMYAKEMKHYDFPLWYDDGILVGEKWEKQIADNIEKCEAVIMFLSKKLFAKDDSYVHKEYKMAKDFFGKKIYIVLLDEVDKKDIPNRFLMWWIDAQELQWIYASQFASVHECVEKIMETVGFSKDKKDLIKRLKEKYNNLSDEEKHEVVENYWDVSLKNNTLLSKATFFAEMQVKGLAGMDRRKDNEPYINVFNDGNNFITIGGKTINSKTVMCFHAGPYDAEKIEIYREGELIYTIGGLLDIYYDKIKMYYDEINDLLYVSYISVSRTAASKKMTNVDCEVNDCIGVSIISNPSDEAIGNDFKELVIL